MTAAAPAGISTQDSSSSSKIKVRFSAHLTSKRGEEIHLFFAFLGKKVLTIAGGGKLKLSTIRFC